MKQPKKILILGGYGKAGRQIANLLAMQSRYTIVIGGRNYAKAEQCTFELLQKFPDQGIKAIKVDAYNIDELSNAAKGVDLVIVCMYLQKKSALNIIEAVLKSDAAHYLDLSPGVEKYAAFKEAAQKVNSSNRVFIMDAGFDPGLPGFLSYMAASMVKNPKEITVEALYKEPDIGKSGIVDILNFRGKAHFWRNDRWQPASFLRMKLVDFPKPYGKTIAIPISLPELEGLPQEYKLQALTVYHAGINSISNTILIFWESGLNKLFSMTYGIKLFQWAIRKFTQPPYGGIVRVTSKGSNGRAVITAVHKKLYEATAIPVVATAIQVLETPHSQGGSYFMGSWVSRNSFLDKMKEMGLSVNVQM